MSNKMTEAEYEQRIRELEAENTAILRDFNSVRDVLSKTELEKEHMAQRISELEREKQYHVGQIEAYRFALKGGAE